MSQVKDRQKIAIGKRGGGYVGEFIRGVSQGSSKQDCNRQKKNYSMDTAGRKVGEQHLHQANMSHDAALY